ncbi:MAG: hypothetical protein ABI398_11715 [Devosia sp.]
MILGDRGTGGKIGGNGKGRATRIRRRGFSGSSVSVTSVHK